MIKLLLSLVLAATTVTGEGFKDEVGAKKVLVIRCQTSDLLNTATYSTLASNMEVVRQQTDRCSYHKLALSYEITGLYTLPHPASYYKKMVAANGREAVRVDAIAMANANGYQITADDYMGYDRVILAQPFNIGGQSWTIATMRTSWIAAALPINLTMHEIGHTWLMHHSQFIKADGTVVEYGDPWDYMGVGGGGSTGTANDTLFDYNPYHKYWSGWIGDAQVVTATTGTYRINRFDDAGATGVVAVKIPAGSFDYWISYRRNFKSIHGAYIVTASAQDPIWPPSTTGDGRKTQLLDMTPATTSATDASLGVGLTYTNGSLSITVLREGGTAPNNWLDVQIQQ